MPVTVRRCLCLWPSPEGAAAEPAGPSPHEQRPAVLLATPGGEAVLAEAESAAAEARHRSLVADASVRAAAAVREATACQPRPALCPCQRPAAPAAGA